MESDSSEKSINTEERGGLTVPCPCTHPSHGPEGCRKPMHAGEEKCPSCKDHLPVPSASVP